MKKYKAIFVDCFGTIVKRKVGPSEVLDIWAERISKEYPILLKSSWRELYNSSDYFTRERNNKIKNIRETTLNDTINDMYLKLNINNYKINESKDKFCKKLSKLYVDVEKENAEANLSLLKFLKKQKSFGTKIYLLTDFYCEKDFYVDLFNSLNILNVFDEIFVSCELFKAKYDGTMYSYVLNKLNLNASDCMMIGDNKFSDIKMAREAGLHTRRITNSQDEKKEKQDYVKQNIDKDLLRIFKSNDKYNYENFAFPLFLFCYKLAKEVEKKNIKDLFFLSREGQLLKLLFDKYCEDFNVHVNTHYLLVSRNSTMIASCEDLLIENFSKIFRENNNISINDFLISLSFNEDERNQIYSTFSFDHNKKIKKFNDSDEFKKLKENKTFIFIYDKLRKEQHANFKKYLNSFNVDFKKEGFYVVDVGWKGTMQDNLKHFLKDCRIVGYYVAILSEGDTLEDNLKIGLVHSNIPFYNFNDKILTYDIIHLEQVLKADHNKICRYNSTPNGIEFTYENSPEAKFFEKQIKFFRNSIEKKFSKICEYYKSHSSENIVAEVKKLYRLMTLKCSYKDYKFMYDCMLEHYDSFGFVGYYEQPHRFFGYIKSKLRAYKRLILEK